MLEHLKHFAEKFAALRLPALWLFILGLPVPVWIIMRSASQEQDLYLIPALLVLLWLLLMFAFLSLFRHVPGRAGSGAGWLMRLRLALRRSMYYVIALFMVLLSIALLITSVQLLGAWLRMY